jgi:hypothetical protein
MKLSDYIDALRPHGLTLKQICAGYRCHKGIDSYEVLTTDVRRWGNVPFIRPSDLNTALHVIRKLRLQ